MMLVAAYNDDNIIYIPTSNNIETQPLHLHDYSFHRICLKSCSCFCIICYTSSTDKRYNDTMKIVYNFVWTFSMAFLYSIDRPRKRSPTTKKADKIWFLVRNMNVVVMLLLLAVCLLLTPDSADGRVRGCVRVARRRCNGNFCWTVYINVCHRRKRDTTSKVAERRDQKVIVRSLHAPIISSQGATVLGEELRSGGGSGKWRGPFFHL